MDTRCGRLRKVIGFWILAVLVLVIGCAHRQPELESPVRDSVIGLLAHAENSFQSGALTRALTQFNHYLYQYPHGGDVDFALLRMGDIYRRLNDPDAARSFYQKLVTERPQSQWVDEARIHLINLLLTGRAETQAVMAATQMLVENPSLPVRKVLWQELARFHRNAGNYAETARYLFFLYQSAPEAENEPWLQQLTAMIDRLDIADIDILWPVMDNDPVRSYLMFRYAMLQVMAENEGDALDILTAFQATYPNHPLWAESAQFIYSLNHRLSFEPYTLGCLLPLSGQFEAYGLRALNGILLALSRLPHGEAAPPIKLIVRDTASQDHQAVQSVRELANARVAAIVGPIVTASAAAQEAQRLGIPMVTFTQKSNITAIGDCVFQHFITPQSQVDTLLNYLFHDKGLRQFAVMYPQETYGQTFMDLFWKAVSRRGGGALKG